MFRFLHAADIHLDSPLRGLSKRDGAPEDEIRGATRRALENLVSLAVESAVDFVVVAGDVYDGDWPDFSTGLFFNRQMRRLGDAGISVYLISGNHDAESKITKQLRFPDNVHVFPTRRPGSVEHPTLPVTLHGQGFVNASVSENLSLDYPCAVKDRFNLGLLHCSIGDSPHAPYSPCTVADLLAKNYDYWALGHIHLHGILHESPYVVYPGNIQGRHARETGERGCYLVSVDDDLSVTSLEFHPLDVVRWKHLRIDLSGTDDAAAALLVIRDRLTETVSRVGPRLLCVRLSLTGKTPLHTHFHASRDAWTAELINVAQEISEDIWIERIRLETNSPVELEQLAEQSDLTAQVIAALQVLDTTALPDRVTDLMSKLPPAAQLELQGLDQERLQANVSALVIDALTASATHEI